MRNQTKFRNNVSKLNYFSRDLAPRQISSCTPRCIWGSPSRTSAVTAASPSPTAPTSRSTWGSISASSPTDVKYVSASSPSSHISSSTSGLTLATSRTSAGYQVNQTCEPIKTTREETRHNWIKSKCVYFLWFCKSSKKWIFPSWPIRKKHCWKNYLLVKWRWKWRYRWQSAATALPPPTTFSPIEVYRLTDKKSGGWECNEKLGHFLRLLLLQAAPRRSPNSRTCSHTPGVTRLTSPTSVTHATNASQMSNLCLTTSQNIRSPST